MNKLVIAAGIIILISSICTIIVFIAPETGHNDVQKDTSVSSSCTTTSITSDVLSTVSTTPLSQTGTYTTWLTKTETSSLITTSTEEETGTTRQMTSTISTKKEEVAFELSVISISGSGLSRTVDAQLVNTGNANAHNIKVKIEAFAGNFPIRLNGDNYIEIEAGTIAAGEAIFRQIELSVSVIDGLKITQQGLRIEMTISSDEYGFTQSYDYQA